MKLNYYFITWSDNEYSAIRFRNPFILRNPAIYLGTIFLLEYQFGYMKSSISTTIFSVIVKIGRHTYVLFMEIIFTVFLNAICSKHSWQVIDYWKGENNFHRTSYYTQHCILSIIRTLFYIYNGNVNCLSLDLLASLHGILFSWFFNNTIFPVIMFYVINRIFKRDPINNNN